jgi:heptosyltransferase-2
LELVRGLGIEVATREPRLTASARMLERAQALLGAAGCDCGRPMVGVAPGAAYGHAKRWPPDRYGRVVARLVRELGVTVVLLGSAYDRNAGYAIESSLTSVGVTGSDAGVVNLIGRTDLSELIGTLAACRGVISGDSGAMHLAAALQVPVTALFGPTDDRLTGPVGAHEVLVHPVWCRPCFFRDCPIDHRCMTRISEDDVFQAISRQLSVPR